MQLWGEGGEKEGLFTQKSIRLYKIFLLPYGNEKAFFTVLPTDRKTASVRRNSANFTSGSVFHSPLRKPWECKQELLEKKTRRKPSAEAWGMMLDRDGLIFAIHSLVLCTRHF